jgi:hypothetical protein
MQIISAQTTENKQPCILFFAEFARYRMLNRTAYSTTQTPVPARRHLLNTAAAAEREARRFSQNGRQGSGLTALDSQS